MDSSNKANLNQKQGVPVGLRDWRQQQPLSAAHLQEPVTWIKRFDAAHGRGAYSDLGYGLVVTAGPNAAADYTDERYWINVAYLSKFQRDESTKTTSTNSVDFAQEKNPPVDASGKAGDGQNYIITAINLAEMAPDKTVSGSAGTGTHTLAAGTPVRFWAIYDQNDPEVRHYVFDRGVGTSSNEVLIKVTGNGTGGGKYTLRVLTGTGTAVTTGNVSMPEGMTVPGSDSALIGVNMAESPASGHCVTANTFHIGYRSGTTVYFAAGLTATQINVQSISYDTGTHVLSCIGTTNTYTGGLLTNVGTTFASTITFNTIAAVTGFNNGSCDGSGNLTINFNTSTVLSP